MHKNDYREAYETYVSICDKVSPLAAIKAVEWDFEFGGAESVLVSKTNNRVGLAGCSLYPEWLIEGFIEATGNEPERVEKTRDGDKVLVFASSIKLPAMGASINWL